MSFLKLLESPRWSRNGFPSSSRCQFRHASNLRDQLPSRSLTYRHAAATAGPHSFAILFLGSNARNDIPLTANGGPYVLAASRPKSIRRVFTWLMARPLLVPSLKGKNHGEATPRALGRSIHFARYFAVSLRTYKSLLEDAHEAREFLFHWRVRSGMPKPCCRLGETAAVVKGQQRL